MKALDQKVLVLCRWLREPQALCCTFLMFEINGNWQLLHVGVLIVILCPILNLLFYASSSPGNIFSYYKGISDK